MNANRQAMAARTAPFRQWVGAVRAVWQEIRASDRRAVQLIAAGACLFTTASIGLAYATEYAVVGWQLWVWLVSCVIVIVTLAPVSLRRVRLSAEGRALLMVMAVAFVLRVTLLETIPGGLHPDETGTAGFTLEHVYSLPDRTLNPFVVSPGSHPTLYHYVTRLFLTVIGHSITGVRFSSVLAGTFAIAATYVCISVFQNRRTALIAAILMAAYHYHIHWSRIALNNVWDTLWIPLMIGAYGWGWKNNNSTGAALSGAAVGFSQYFYQGGRAGLFVLAFVILGLWWKDRDRRKLIVHVGKLVAVAAVIAAPLAMFAIKNPATFTERFNTIFGWQPSVIQEITGSPTDYWGFFWYQLWRSFGAYTAVVDITGFYRPEVPLTIGLAAPLLIVGFFWAIRKRQYVPALWLFIATVLGGFMLSGAPSSSHYVLSIPAICWLIAIVIKALMDGGHPRWAIAVLLIIVATDLVFYFGIYLQHPSGDLVHPFPVLPPRT